MKKTAFLALLCVCAILCTACANSNNVGEETTTEGIGTTTVAEEKEPTTLKEMQSRYPEYNIFCPQAYFLVAENPNGTPDPTVSNDVPQTATAENLTMKTEQETYTSDFDTIKVTLTKSGDDKDFFYCSALRLERLENGEWKRLYFIPEAYMNGDTWPIISPIEDPKTVFGARVETTFEIKHSYCVSAITPGEYRAVAFAGHECAPIYAYFKIS